MPTISLDEFVESLRNSISEAQAKLERNNQGRLERMIELARDGRSEALTWSFVIDGPDGIGPAGQRVRLPLMTMFPPMAVHVSEAKLDLNVALIKAPVSWRAKSHNRLRLQICRGAASLRRRFHQLTVHLSATQEAAAEVSLDGVHFKSIGAPPTLQSTPHVKSCDNAQKAEHA